MKPSDGTVQVEVHEEVASAEVVAVIIRRENNIQQLEYRSK
jgi:hypothetical protein